MAVVRALATRQEGFDRSRIIELTSLSDGGTLSTTLAELEQCGFVRAYKDFTRDKNGQLFQLIDPFVLFWLRFVEDSDDPRWWSANRNGGVVRAWTGRAFELVCLWHVPQILRALGIWGVSVAARSWRSKVSDPGAQIDLVLDRADNIINLCEMKWVGSGSEYALDSAYAKELRRKSEVFAAETQTAKALHTTLVTPGGLRHNQYAGAVQAVVTAADLFA